MALTQALVRGSSRRWRICCIRSLSTPGIAVPSRLCSPGKPTPHQLGAFHGEIGPNCNRSDLEILRGRLRRLLRRVTAGVVDPYPPIIATSVLQHCPRASDRCSQRRVAAPPLPGLARRVPIHCRPPETCRLRHFLDMRLVPPDESRSSTHQNGCSPPRRRAPSAARVGAIGRPTVRPQAAAIV